MNLVSKLCLCLLLVGGLAMTGCGGGDEEKKDDAKTEANAGSGGGQAENTEPADSADLTLVSLDLPGMT